jgi:hypothetical protein
MIPLADLIEKLKYVDEISLLEILDISSEDIVDRFSDIIEEKYDLLAPEYDEQDFQEE